MIAQAPWLGNIESFQSRNAVAVWNAQSQHGFGCTAILDSDKVRRRLDPP
jgi:hypothetical protein